jgi:hypothetical protein
MLNSINANYKEYANSITQFCYNLIGYLPAPTLYGVICSITGGSESRFGLVFLMLTSLIGVLYLKKSIDVTEQQEMNIDMEKQEVQDNYNFMKMSLFRRNTELLTSFFGRTSNYNMSDH